MALLRAESWDTAATFVRRRWATAGTFGPTLGSTGRNGTSGVRFSNQSQRLQCPIPGNPQTVIFGFAFRPFESVSQQIWTLYDERGGGTQCAMAFVPDGSLQFYRGNVAGAPLGRSLGQLPHNVYTYLEFKVTIGTSVLGSILCRANGAPFFNLTALNTRATVNDVVGRFVFGLDGALANGGTWDLDDFYLCDTTGGAPDNDFLGDIWLQARRPNAAGTHSQFAIGGSSPPAQAFQAVDDSTPNDTLDYIHTTTAGHKHSFGYEELVTAAGDVKLLALTAFAGKNGTGLRQYRQFVRHGGLEAAAPTRECVAGGFAAHQEVVRTNPSTGAAFTLSEFSATECGVEVVM